MAATTPNRPVAPGISIGFAAPEEEDEAPPLPALVPGLRVPVPPTWLSPPAQVYEPLMTLFGPERGLNLAHALSMLLVDCKLKAPRTSESLGSTTLEFIY